MCVCACADFVIVRTLLLPAAHVGSNMISCCYRECFLRKSSTRAKGAPTQFSQLPAV